jgi:hypothetical protein
MAHLVPSKHHVFSLLRSYTAFRTRMANLLTPLFPAKRNLHVRVLSGDYY